MNDCEGGRWRVPAWWGFLLACELALKQVKTLVGRRKCGWAISPTTAARFLLDLGAGPSVTLASAWGHRVRMVRATCPDKPEFAASSLRPDGFVAWAADRGAVYVELPAALTRWCGAPQGDTSAAPSLAGPHRESDRACAQAREAVLARQAR